MGTVYPGLQLLDLLLPALHRYLLRFVQAVLQVLDGLLHVFLHALQVGAGVLLLLQLLRHHGCVGDGLLGLLFGVSALLHGLLHLILNLGDVSLQLLLLVQQAGVLGDQDRTLDRQ